MGGNGIWQVMLYGGVMGKNLTEIWRPDAIWTHDSILTLTLVGCIFDMPQYDGAMQLVKSSFGCVTTRLRFQSNHYPVDKCYQVLSKQTTLSIGQWFIWWTGRYPPFLNNPGQGFNWIRARFIREVLVLFYGVVSKYIVSHPRRVRTSI